MAFDSPYAVELKGVSFKRGTRLIYDQVDIRIPRGKVTGIMGPSGSGKTTLLRLIAAQLRPSAGEIWVNGANLPQLSRGELFEMRRQMGVLFQSGALFTDLDVFENVAFPLRVHTKLPEEMIRDIVLLKLQAVGLRGAVELMPDELSGGMKRRVALARAIALDPQILMYDEPFVGQDPIAMGVLVRLIRLLNPGAGADQHRGLPRSGRDRQHRRLPLCGGRYQGAGAGHAEGIARVTGSAGPPVHAGHPRWPGTLPFRRAGSARCLAGETLMRKVSAVERIRRLGRAGLDVVAAIGRSVIVLVLAVFGRGGVGSGLQLLGKQLYSVGVLSLPIIVVSGFFIGMVIALQGYNILVKYGSEQAVGQMVALTLLRELGPVVTALLFAGRAGSALTAEIGNMKSTEQLSSLEMIGVDPLKYIVAPRFWAGFISMPLLAAMFSVVGIWGAAMVAIDWLGVYDGSFWATMQNSVMLSDVLNGVIKSLVFAFVVTWVAVFQGYDCEPTSEGIGRATTRTVVYASLAVLGLDFILTALMFGDL
ncbi:ABC transport permease subunit [Pseudomonas psychrotolerans]|nr:ABC transport permease subunit [Pseudomonas psychrotolerans]